MGIIMLSHAWSYVRRFRYCKLRILKFWAGWDQKNNSKRCCGIQGFQNKKDFCWWDTNFCYWRSGISYHFLFEIHRIPLKFLVTLVDIMVIKLVSSGPSPLFTDEFKNFFSKYGKVVEHEIIRDHVTKRSRGFGFIVFDNDQVVDTVLANGNMIDMEGTQVSSVLWVTMTSDVQRPIFFYNYISTRLCSI